ncbi:probable ADP-ribosylation factor GTPase-activating protein AGD14 [Chenopodium quinoa]|uniref:probable ADP-ribosylation factor GTPase-activating protein AGD14 n=1 Tax=Chenopodium quinoa TaxID=63459 RepID=UPI000B7894E5|nr:probable ADP-ribosylation factor GTPase-activating protein AGD14 [Chenopodium quinoa]
MSSKREEERNEKIIRGLMKLPPNRRCINCNSLGPQYVCTNFWTFVCMICSGIHREFTHRVKSVSMSKFTSQEVEALQNGGNQRAREIYLKDWDLHRQRQPNNSDVDKVREFIKSVYINRKYAGGNNSEKSPGDTQIQRNAGDETRRASSYHSFSQSPPYDFQYEDRLNRKNIGSLSRKPGSDHNLYERKTASFIYSPGRLSEHHYEDKFANDGSSSRVSDYSYSSGGDPCNRSNPHSPNFQKDDGFSSPASDSSREIIDGLHRQTSSTHSEFYAKRDTDKAPLPRPQRTVSLGSVGSFEKNSVSLQSTDSGSLTDVKFKPNHSYAATQNKVSSTPSQFPVGGLNLFEDAFPRPAAINPILGVDLLQAPSAGPVSSIDLFQPSADSPDLSQKFPQTSSSSSSFFSQNPPVSNLNHKLSEPTEPSNEGWATFDSPQPSSPCTNTSDTGGFKAGPEDGVSAKNLSSAVPSNVTMQWLEFPSSTIHSPPHLVSNLWNEGLTNVHIPTDMPNTQNWKAFEEANKQQHPCTDVEGINLHASADNNSSSTDLFFGLKTPQDSVVDELQQISSTEGFSFPTLPSHGAFGSSFVEPIHPFMNNVTNSEQKVGNPFDVPFDSELEAHNTFLDMSTLQAALPSTQLPSSFMGGVDEPWFPGNPVVSPGGMSYMVTQAPSSQLPNVPSHGPVASVGGNPFA